MEKTHNYPSFWKSFQQVARALVVVRKRKNTHILVLAYDANFKKKQQDQGGKNWRYTNILSHRQSQISELLRSALKILSFWINFE